MWHFKASNCNKTRLGALLFAHYFPHPLVTVQQRRPIMVDDKRKKSDEPKDGWESFAEEIEVAGSKLVEEITRLVSEGNVRKLRIRSANDDMMIEVPLTGSVVVGGVVVLAAPWLAILGGLAGVLAKVKIEVIRDAETETGEPDTEDAPKKKKKKKAKS